MKFGISNENTWKIFWHQLNFAGIVGVSDSEGNAALLHVIFVITSSFKILAVNFNCTRHEISEISFIVIKENYQPGGRDS